MAAAKLTKRECADIHTFGNQGTYLGFALDRMEPMRPLNPELARQVARTVASIGLIG
jgi:hypothetical protein